MRAVIESGGKQYKVKEGDSILVELLSADVGEEVSFNVLYYSDDEAKVIAESDLGKTSVKGIMRGIVKGKKLHGIKYKKRSSSQMKRFGHRQHYARVEITDIAFKK